MHQNLFQFMLNYSNRIQTLAEIKLRYATCTNMKNFLLIY